MFALKVALGSDLVLCNRTESAVQQRAGRARLPGISAEPPERNLSFSHSKVFCTAIIPSYKTSSSILSFQKKMVVPQGLKSLRGDRLILQISFWMN